MEAYFFSIMQILGSDSIFDACFTELEFGYQNFGESKK
jgi:hypothetical protein